MIPHSENIAKSVTGHDGIDQDLQQHDNQIVEYTNSKVETTGKKKIKWDSGIGNLLSIKSMRLLIYLKSLKELLVRSRLFSDHFTNLRC